MEDWRVPSEYDRVMETRSWINKIPYINFDSNHKVRVIPPFSGATIRFNVKNEETDKAVSVYLDCYNNLGCMDYPYWEVYPINGDTFRCKLDDTDDLLQEIRKEINTK